MAVVALDEKVHRVVSAALDQAFYRAAYPELNRPGFDPIRHYLEEGWREGRDPAPWFSVRGYLALNGDIAEAGIEPLHHYLTQGRFEAREVMPSEFGEAYLARRSREGATPAWSYEPPAPQVEVAPPPAAPASSLGDRKAVEADFDAAFYLKTYPDIAATGADPLDHYLEHGWREGRDPNPSFSTRDYLENYPDIAASGVNPFVHYVRAGRAEGRSARSELGFRYEILARGRPVADRIDDARLQGARIGVDDPAKLAAGLNESRTGLADLHVTFSHDDYTANTGGVQLCVQREERRVAELGRDHLHIFPANGWPILRMSERTPLGVVLNGRTLGLFDPAAVTAVLRQQAPAGPGARSLAIHSLLGHRVDEVLAILDALDLRAGFFWLHDFASLCAGFHLLRNEVQDCAAPPPDSAACGICAFGPWRQRHLAEHERLFAALDLTVVSPSQPTLDLWLKSWRFRHRAAVVHPHAALVERGAAPAPAAGPMRIAYVGFPVPHKGWPIFRELAARFADDARYEFVHLGGREVEGTAAAFHRVWVSEDEPRAMQQALEALAVDAVLLWPLCRETFSFAAYEAVAAGCAVITWPDSGNVAAFVQGADRGVVLPDEAALAQAFEDGSIAALSRAQRSPMLYDLAFSRISLDLAEAAQ